MAYDPTRTDRPNLSRYGNTNSQNLSRYGNTGNVYRYGNSNNTANNAAGVGNANAFNNANNQGGYGGGGGQDGGEQIRDILHVIFKRKKLILLLFLAVALPGIVATALQKPSYLASAMVMISSQRSNSELQPTDLTRLAEMKLNESLVNSEVHLVKSRELVERVVRELSRSDDGTMRVSGQSYGKQVLSLRNKLSVVPVKGSNVIRIDFKSAEADQAARVVNRVVDEYLAYHAEVHGTQSAMLPQFYEEQKRDLDKELREAEQALLAFTYETGLVAPADEISLSMRAQNEVRGTLREVATTISGTRESLEVLREQIAEQPELVKQAQSLEVSPTVKQLSTHLTDRRVDRVGLLQKYTEADRLARDNAQEINELESELEAEVAQRPTVVANELIRINPLRENLLREMLQKESRLREMSARQATLEEEERELGGRLLQLRKDAMEYEALQQEVKLRRDSYDLYLKRAQEARISQAMDKQRLVNVQVVQRPALPLPRADANQVTLSLSLIAGLLVGIAGAFGREYMSRSLRSEYDVQRHLGLPLLASIGDVEKR
jgi:uncharacterized protein involved in exopolysaccharide biosynthesis